MEQILAHLVGDYLLQNKWLATEKLKKTWVALVHGTVYTVPFVLITSSGQALLVIALTHALIDRFGIGNRVMWLIGNVAPTRYQMSWKKFQKTNAGMPDWLFFSLRVASDNTMHLVINYFAIKYL